MGNPPVNPAATTAALQQEWAVLRALFAELSPTQFAMDSVLPGWTNGDIFAHIIGTESLLAGRSVPEHDVQGRPHVRNRIGELNEKWLEEFRGQDLRPIYDAIITERTAGLAVMSDDELMAETMTPAGPDSYARFMRIRVFDCWIHELDVRDGLGLAPPSSATPAAIAADEAAASLPYVLAKRVGVPIGTTVRVELTGLVDRVLVVEVAERARLIAPDHADPDVVIRVDTCEFFRLIGGRRDARPSAVVVASGDRDVGQQIAGKLAYTI